MRLLAASVRGPAHERAKRPNEDACRGKATVASFWMAVADGMGSRPMARAGARAAVGAAARAWRLWSARADAEPADFARLCGVLWRLALPEEVTPADAASTLVFCGGFAHRQGLCAQLGDGLVGHRTRDGFVALTQQKDGFSNQTVGLGTTDQLADWLLRPIQPVGPGEAYLLASDGVSDDLVMDRAAGLVDWIIRDFGDANRSHAGHDLRRMLLAWPVPHHLDDKSIALAWNPAQ